MIWLCPVTWLDVSRVCVEKNSEKRNGENFIPKMLKARASNIIINNNMMMMMIEKIFQTRDDVCCDIMIHPSIIKTLDRICPRSKSNCMLLIPRHQENIVAWNSEIYRYVSTTPITKANHPLVLMKRCICFTEDRENSGCVRERSCRLWITKENGVKSVWDYYDVCLCRYWRHSRTGLVDV